MALKIPEKTKSDTEKNVLQACKAWDMIPELLEKIMAEADRYYREGSIGILETCNGQSEETSGIIHITDMTRQGNKVIISGLAGSPLYIALYLHQYEEAEQILECAPETAEPGYTAQQFRITYSPGNTYFDALDFPTGGEVYLEEMLLTDPGLPDSLCSRLWNIWFRRKAEDRPGLFAEEMDGNEVPLLIREWPDRVKARRRFGDLKHITDSWFKGGHSREEYESYHKDLKADMEQFWKGLKGLYRLRTLDKSLYESHVDERLAAHLMLKLMMILLQFVQLEGMLLMAPPEKLPMNSTMTAADKLLLAALDAMKSEMTENPEAFSHIKRIRLTVDGTEALRKLKKGLEKLGFTYFSGDTLWNACMDYHYHVSDQTRVFWVAFDIWKTVFEGELLLTMDGKLKERSEQLWTALMYDDGWRNRTNCENTQSESYMLLLRHLDGLQWTGHQDSEWLEKKRHTAGRLILQENDRELLLLTLEKNVFLTEDMDFLWKNYCEEEQMKLKPLLLMKKYGCL